MDSLIHSLTASGTRVQTTISVDHCMSANISPNVPADNERASDSQGNNEGGCCRVGESSQHMDDPNMSQ